MTERRPGETGTCLLASCERQRVRRGMCRNHYETARHPLATPRKCVVCGASNSPEARVLTFTVRASVPLRGTIAAGGLRLCERCWAKHAAPRRKPRLRVAA